jgi:hypothetical protein
MRHSKRECRSTHSQLVKSRTRITVPVDFQVLRQTFATKTPKVLAT